MRKIGRSEIVLWKCPTCGSKNKIYTILRNAAGDRIGSSLKCCNCGTLLKRLDDLDDTIIDENHGSFARCGDEYCIKLHWCPKCKDCKLRNHSEDDSDDKDDDKKPCDCNCDTCPYRYCCKKSKCNQLVINVKKVTNYID
jgi:hypothetical protein